MKNSQNTNAVPKLAAPKRPKLNYGQFAAASHKNSPKAMTKLK